MTLTRSLFDEEKAAAKARSSRGPSMSGPSLGGAAVAQAVANQKQDNSKNESAASILGDIFSKTNKECKDVAFLLK